MIKVTETGKLNKTASHLTGDGTGHVAQRTCIVTRAHDAPENLIRFVLSPEGVVTADLKRKLPGRGVWLRPRRAIVEKAVAKNLFQRGFRQTCKTPGDLAAQVDSQLEAACLGYLSLANKAGAAIRGFDKVLNVISKGQISVLIAASDGSADGISKLEGKCRAKDLKVYIADLFTSRQLDLAFGGTNVIHAAITHSALADRFAAAARKLACYRGQKVKELLKRL